MVFNDFQREGEPSDPRASMVSASTASFEPRSQTPVYDRDYAHAPASPVSPTRTRAVSNPEPEVDMQRGYYYSSAETNVGAYNEKRVEDGPSPNHPYSPIKKRENGHPYRTEWRERQGSGSSSSHGDHDAIHGAGAYADVRPRKTFLKRLTTCFEFDESTDPVRRYRSKHEEMYGKNPVYAKPETEPSQRAPNSFAGGMTGASGTGGAGVGGGEGGN